MVSQQKNTGLDIEDQNYEEKIDVLLSKEKENQNSNVRTYHFLNSVSQFTRQEVGTTIRCGPHIPLYAAKYANKDIV